jgi:hypothetical protein
MERQMPALIEHDAALAHRNDAGAVVTSRWETTSSGRAPDTRHRDATPVGRSDWRHRVFRRRRRMKRWGCGRWSGARREYASADANLVGVRMRSGSIVGPMPNRFRSKLCVFCPLPSVGVGEHVLSAWFLGEFKGEGPFHTDKNGEPILKRKPKKEDRTRVEHGSLQGIHVPACESCNTALDKHFEKLAKPVIRKLMPRSATFGRRSTRRR